MLKRMLYWYLWSHHYEVSTFMLQYLWYLYLHWEIKSVVITKESSSSFDIYYDKTRYNTPSIFLDDRFQWFANSPDSGRLATTYMHVFTVIYANTSTDSTCFIFLFYNLYEALYCSTLSYPIQLYHFIKSCECFVYPSSFSKFCSSTLKQSVLHISTNKLYYYVVKNFRLLD